MPATVYVRSQTDLLTDLSLRVNDASFARWTEPQMYAALRAGIEAWGERVRVPFLYTFDITSSAYEYTLPAYIDGPMRVQRIIGLVDSGIASAQVWEDIPFWEVYPDTSGSRTLRLDFLSGNTDGRIIWWGRNGPIPITSTEPVLNATALTTSSTSFTLTTVPIVGQSGYVKIDAEWMSYAGMAEAATTITCSGNVRGLFGTTAATHAGGSTVLWGVAVPRYDLYTQLMLEAQVYLHNLYLNRTQSSQDSESHMNALRLAKQQAVEFWRSYVPMKIGGLKGNRRTVGPGDWDKEIIWSGG